MGEKAHLVVATVGKRTMVLGVTEHGIRRIMDIAPEDAPAQIEEHAKPATFAFHAKLTSLLSDLRGGRDKDSRDALEQKNYALLALEPNKAEPKDEFESNEMQDEVKAPAVSAPLLRVANDSREHHAPRIAVSEPSMLVEEQVSGLLAARARRS